VHNLFPNCHKNAFFQKPSQIKNGNFGYANIISGNLAQLYVVLAAHGAGADVT
jgi:hypothetical protein